MSQVSNPNEVLINLYVENRKEFARVITLSGGHAEMILNTDWWEKVMFALATNNIAVEATYRGEPE